MISWYGLKWSEYEGAEQSFPFAYKYISDRSHHEKYKQSTQNPMLQTIYNFHFSTQIADVKIWPNCKQKNLIVTYWNCDSPTQAWICININNTKLYQNFT